MANFITFIIQKTYKLRIAVDKVVYWGIKSFNHWEILDRYKGRDTLVVGNGPSINHTKLADINMVSIGMNKINLLFDRSEWRPDIITCVNGLVIRQNRKFFNSRFACIIFKGMVYSYYIDTLRIEVCCDLQRRISDS